MAKSPYRTSTNISGRRYNSPRFDKKSDMNKWVSTCREINKKVRNDLDITENEKAFCKKNKISLPQLGKLFGDFVLEYFEGLLDSIESGELSPQTFDKYAGLYANWIEPNLKDKWCQEIEQSNIRGILKKIKKEGFGRDHRNAVRSLCERIFDEAIAEGYCKINPAVKASIDRGKTAEPKIRHLGDIEKIFEYLDAAKRMPVKFKDTKGVWHVASSFMLETGNRKQNTIALKWKHLDLNKKKVRFEERFIQGQNTISDGMKNGDDFLEVDLSDSLVSLLKKHRLRTPYSSDEDYVFCRHGGKHLDPRTMLRWHHSCCLEVEIDPSSWTIHSMRHEVATHWLNEGESLEGLQRRFGWKSRRSAERYAKVKRQRDLEKTNKNSILNRRVSGGES